MAAVSGVPLALAALDFHPGAARRAYRSDDCIAARTAVLTWRIGFQ